MLQGAMPDARGREHCHTAVIRRPRFVDALERAGFILCSATSRAYWQRTASSVGAIRLEERRIAWRASRARASGIVIAWIRARAEPNGRATLMWLYAARRIMLAIPIALGVTIMCFGLVYLAPGDPVQNLLPPDATQADVDLSAAGLRFRSSRSPIQYLKWLLRAGVRRFRHFDTDQPAGARRGVACACRNTLIVSFGAVTGRLSARAAAWHACRLLRRPTA